MRKGLILLFGLLLIGSNVDVKAAYSEDNLVFLCFGQSNMQGNATPRDKDYTMDSYTIRHFKKMYCADSDGSKKGTWDTAYPPLCRKGCGLTPVDYFGRYLCDSLASRYKIYVIVVAVAGCGIKMFDKDQYSSYISTQETWMKNIANDYGGNPYGRLIEMAKIAQETGVIKGILMHQGETDADNQAWIDNVQKIYSDIITDLGLKKSQVPLLVGELVGSDQNGACAGKNVNIQALGNLRYTYAISSKGCPAESDHLHFTAEGYEILGKRYGEEMFNFLKKKGYTTKSAVTPVPDEPDDTAPAYNLQGQQIYAPASNFIIHKGKKYLYITH